MVKSLFINGFKIWLIERSIESYKPTVAKYSNVINRTRLACDDAIANRVSAWSDGAGAADVLVDALASNYGSETATSVDVECSERTQQFSRSIALDTVSSDCHKVQTNRQP